MTLTDERRLVTVLFADLVGFTGRAEQNDPETVRELQRRYFAAVSGEVERFGGTVEKFIGDAVMAIFGAPQAHDDDAERALRAAIGIRQAVTQLDPELEVRIGLNTGEVVGGMGTGPHAGDYTVSGDAVNVAARLQQNAQPNEILVGGTTRALSAEAFAFAPLAELALKGRTEGIEAWRLERELPDRPRLRGGEARLVGRARELTTLESALDEVVSGRGLMVALVGEAGIGKSRLALEIRQRAEADGFASAWTTSRSYSSAFPYHLLAQLVHQLLRRQSGAETAEGLRARGVEADQATLERWAAVLDDVLGESADDAQLTDLSPAGRQRMLVHALSALLRAASDRQPLLVILDDLHWADPASLAVVEELLDVMPELRVMMLALYRSGWSHGWEAKSSYQQLNLRALRPEEARQLAAQLVAGGDISRELTKRVLERSAGNPFFLEELLRGERPAAGDEQRRLPETIHEMLLARLDALPPGIRQVLQLAAVIGMEFSDRIVSALAADGAADGELDVEDAVRALQRAELIVPRPGDQGERMLAFRHPLIHEVAYRSLLLSTRRSLHRRIARWLEEHGGEELLSALALHYRDSDDPAKARHYLPLAGQRAESLNATREAYGWYMDAAAAFPDEPARRGELLEAAARQIYLIGDIEAAIQQQLKAIELYETAGADVAALNGRRWLGRYYWLHGNPGESEHQNQLAISGLERLPPTPELAYAYSFRSQSLMLMPDFAAGAAWARKAIEVAEATDAIGALAHAYNNLGTSLVGQGDPDGLEYLRRSLALALEHSLTDDAGRAYANMSGQGNRIFPFRYAESEAFLQEAISYAQRTIPDGVFDQWIRSGYAEFLVVSARWSEAERVMNEMDWARAGLYIQVSIQTLRSHLACYRGQYDEAEALVTQAAEDAIRIGDLQAVLPTLAALAQAEAGLGKEAAAVASLRRAIEQRGSNPEATISTWFLFEGTDALASGASDSDDVRSGIQLMSDFVAALAPVTARRAGSASVEVERALFGASVEQLASACRRMGIDPPSLEANPPFPDRADAARVLDEHHRLFEAARIRLWLAEDVGDPSLLANARETFEELGAHPYLGRAARL